MTSVIDEKTWFENRTRTNPVIVLDPDTFEPRLMYGRVELRQSLLGNDRGTIGWSPSVIMNPEDLTPV